MEQATVLFVCYVGQFCLLCLAPATLLMFLLHFLNFLSFYEYLSGKDGVALYTEPLCIRAYTVYEIKRTLLLSPGLSWTRRLLVDCNEISMLLRTLGFNTTPCFQGNKRIRKKKLPSVC
jgi:hypothetical protein